MVKRKLSAAVIEKESYLVWNAFVDLLAMEDESKLSEIQKIAQDSFWYDAEVQNGGHLQYFENTRKKDYSSVINSLRILGASKHAKVLENAVKQLKKKNRKIIESVQEYVDIALEGEYEKYDDAYAEIMPEMNEYLERYLEKNIKEFIEIEN
jgi:hypothetical protein